MEFKTEDLLSKNPFEYEAEAKQAQGCFGQSLIEEIIYHYENNDKYRRFCENKCFNPYEWDGCYENIPPVHVSVFKELGKDLASVKKEDIKLTLQSSATSGVPSSVPIDRLTAKRQAKAMVNVIGDVIGLERKPFLVMDVNPEEGFREILGARYAAVSGYLKFASKTGYFLKVNENKQYYFDIEGIEEFIESLNYDEPAVVFGFTYILFSEVLNPIGNMGKKYKLPKGSKIIHIGGWKKLESEKISKEEFNIKAAEIFGVDITDVIDVYGFTEQMGINYPECKCGFKHVPLYSEIIVRDPVAKTPLESGKEGVLEFLSPVPHSYPGNVVLTDDVGFWDDKKCPYGKAGRRFKIIGRLKKTEARGCGDILSSKIKFIDSVKFDNNVDDKKFQVIYFSEKDSISNLERKAALIEIEKKLRRQLTWLRNQPIDALIGLISKVAEKWAGDVQGEDYLKQKLQGYMFLKNWCTVEHLSSVMTEGLNGNRKHMDTFIPISNNSVQLRKAVSRGLACHWLAGNVQILGMFVLVESILCKNVNLLKVSSQDDGVFESLIKAFEGESFSTQGGYTIYGDDLLRTMAVVYYDHKSVDIGKTMSMMADIRIAWGGRESVMAVSGFPSKYDCQDLIMGPKVSFSAIAREMIDDERMAKKLARKVSIDASVFDQTGCASTHNVYVEKGAFIYPEKFAEYLAEAMKKTAVQIPKGDMSAEQVAQIHSVRGVYDFKGTVYGDDNNDWTVLYSDDKEYCVPVYGRVVFVHPVDDIDDVVDYIDDNIQTIGLAARGGRAIEFAIKASDKGAVRFPACGKMLNFDSPWDGMYLTDRMVKWVTIGGPNV